MVVAGGGVLCGSLAGGALAAVGGAHGLAGRADRGEEDFPRLRVPDGRPAASHRGTHKVSDTLTIAVSVRRSDSMAIRRVPDIPW